MANKSANNSVVDRDYEKLGRLLVSLGELGYKDRKKLYRMSFVKGFISGAGGVLGATIGIAIVLFLLSIVGEIPFIGTVAESIRNTIDSGTN